jgi:hypothetical protein
MNPYTIIGDPVVATRAARKYEKQTMQFVNVVEVICSNQAVVNGSTVIYLK